MSFCKIKSLHSLSDPGSARRVQINTSMTRGPRFAGQIGEVFCCFDWGANMTTVKINTLGRFLWRGGGNEVEYLRYESILKEIYKTSFRMIHQSSSGAFQPSMRQSWGRICPGEVLGTLRSRRGERGRSRRAAPRLSPHACSSRSKSGPCCL